MFVPSQQIDDCLPFGLGYFFLTWQAVEYCADFSDDAVCPFDILDTVMEVVVVIINDVSVRPLAFYDMR